MMVARVKTLLVWFTCKYLSFECNYVILFAAAMGVFDSFTGMSSRRCYYLCLVIIRSCSLGWLFSWLVICDNLEDLSNALHAVSDICSTALHSFSSLNLTLSNLTAHSLHRSLCVAKP